MMVRYRENHDTLELCNRAGAMLKRVGFVHHQTSRKTEATYYRWPDRPHLLRVATHSRKNARNRHSYGPVAATITFRGTHIDKPGMMNISSEKVDQVIALAIGRYFLRSCGEFPQQREIR